MKKLSIIHGLLLICFLTFVGQAVAASPLKVLSAVPRGTDGVSERQAVSITFNQPVAALAEASQFSSEDCPLSITPNVPGTCRYSGTQTLLFEPTENWPQATRFTVQLKKGFTSRVSGQKLTAPYSFSFTTKTPRVTQVLPRNNEHWISLNPSFYVEMNMPIAPEKLPAFVSLTDEKGQTVALSARALTEEEWKNNFSYVPQNQQAVLSPSRTLRKGTRYTLTFKSGLPSLQGPLGMQKAYTTHFFTYPELAIQGVKNQGCLPFTPGIRFSSPVRLRELLASMQVSVNGIMRPVSEQMLETLGNEVVLQPEQNRSDTLEKNYEKNYGLTPEEIKQGVAFFFLPLSFLNLPPKEPVQITISKNLRDIYGNHLGTDYSFEIANEGYCPAAEFSGGFGVLESYLSPRLPIELMNIPSLPVRAARFNKENFIPFDVQETRYCRERTLEHPTYQGDYTFKNSPDKTLKTFFDLAKFKPTGSDSIIFTQVELPRRGEDKPCWTGATSNLTDVGVTFKTSPESILVWTTSLETGEPLAAMNVELRDTANRVLWSGSTDDNGLAFAPGWEKLDTKKTSWGQPKLYAFISSAGGDAVLNTELNDGLELWRFNIPFTYSPQRETLRVALFTERGIYRPGETMYVKGVVREFGKKGLTIPTGLKGTLTLTDNRGSEIASREIALSDQGSFTESFEISPTARTGEWDLAFTPKLAGVEDPFTQYASVRVEAVKQADFEVTIHPEKQNYLSGSEAKFSTTARYNFGAPLGNAPVKWSLRREMAWFEPKGYDGYIFTPYFLREDEQAQNGKLLLSQTGQTDDKGALSFSAPLPVVKTPTDVFVEVRVQSPAKQDLFSRTSVKVHPADFYLGTKLLTQRTQAGQPIEAQVVAVTPEGKQVPAHVVATIRKIQWYSVRKTGLSGRLEWVNEKQEVELPAQTFEVTDKGATFSFTPQEGGNYQITFSSSDASGRKAWGGFDVYISGKEDTYWQQNDDDLLTLKQDKNTYKPGQKARIHVQSPYPGAYALVTVEREGILDAWVTSVKQGTDYIDVPIKENYLPNVYVGVSIVRGRSADPVNDKGLDLGKPQGKTGYVMLNVAPEKKRMAVSIKTNAKKYRPGQEVTVQLQTKADGKANPAEVTVMVVDEGILALTDYKTPDLFNRFYQSVPLSVFTAANRSYVIGQRNFGEKGENRGGGGSGLSKLGGTDLRSHFSFVPYYNATVQTDVKGRATLRFKLPDNLTKFRVMAVAAREADFGSAETFIEIAKPLMITANLPRVARVEDAFRCAAVVYNYEDKKGELTVFAQAHGAVELTGSTAQTVQVPLGGAKEVSWECKALHPGEGELIFRVEGKGKEHDAMLAKLPVESIEKSQTLAVYGSTENSREELIDKPGSVSPLAKNQVELALASTALLQLKGALSYLINYPFDCFEQQLSKSLPIIAGEKLVKDFKLGDINSLKKKAQAMLDRFSVYQAPSGGFGYWPGVNLADPYLTAYAMEVAYLAKQNGYKVDEASLKEAVTWLQDAFNVQTQRAYTYSSYENDTARAYAAYVLALYGKNTDALFNNLYAKRTALPLPAVAYLLEEAQLSKRAEDVKKALAQQLLNRATHTPTAVYFSSTSSMPWLHIDDVVSTALALDALENSAYPFKQAYQSVSWLLEQLSAQGYWNSTQANALVFTALSNYYARHESVEPNFTAQVTQGNQTWQTASFQGRSVEQKVQTIPFEAIYPQGTEARLRFAKQGTGTLYYTLSQIYAPARYDRPVNAGFEVVRTLTTPSGEPITQVIAGQRYQITLTVRSTAAHHFVVLEDFVPAGFEIVQTSLATESTQTQKSLDETNSVSPFINNEKYDAHIAAFADYLPAGTHTYSYAVNALVSGTFAWPSAWVSEMYDPSVFGRNTTSSITIK